MNPCIVATFGNFKNGLIFRTLAVFRSHFSHRTTLMCLKKRFSHVLANFLTQTEYFAWAIASALRPFLAILKMLLFCDYELFFGAVLCTQQVSGFFA